jgi:hypothetical protein
MAWHLIGGGRRSKLDRLLAACRAATASSILSLRGSGVKWRVGRGGAVINISSASARPGSARLGSARLGSPNEYVDYAASKGALETFTTRCVATIRALGLGSASTGSVPPSSPIHRSLVALSFQSSVSTIKPDVASGASETGAFVGTRIDWCLSGRSFVPCRLRCTATGDNGPGDVRRAGSRENDQSRSAD